VNPKKLLLKAGFDDIVKEVAAAFAVIQKKAAVPDQGRDRAPGK
jgi:hypothetical protein